MASVDRCESCVAAGEVGSLQSKVHEFFKDHKMRVVGEQAGEIHALQGSPWLARLFGLRWSRPGWLPKRAFVKLKRGEKGVIVRAEIEDSSTLQDVGPVLRAKYQAYFEQWMTDLKAHLESVGGSEERHATG
jgi:hypothetical protein